MKMIGKSKYKGTNTVNGFGEMNGTMINGHRGQNDEVGHFNGIPENTPQAELTNGTSHYTNGYIEHAGACSTTSIYGYYGQTACEDEIISLKQTEQRRHMTTESNPNSEPNNNGEQMYDLCDRLSSVGMEDEAEDCMCEVSVRPAFSDNIAEAKDQVATRWTQENLFKQDKDGDTYLHTAIILLQMDLAMTLINAAFTPRLLSTMNKLSQSPMYLAVLTNQVDIVRRLMVGGAEIVSRDRKGSTPLHVACEKGYKNIVEKLLEPVRYHETKMNTNYEIPYQKIPQDLEIANYDGKTVLHVAYEGGTYDIVKILIEKRANVNARDGKTGRTILHCACLDGKTELVRYLLSLKECNINAKSYDDYTPFDFARIRGHTEIAILLAQAGACNRDDDDLDE